MSALLVGNESLKEDWKSISAIGIVAWDDVLQTISSCGRILIGIRRLKIVSHIHDSMTIDTVLINCRTPLELSYYLVLTHATAF
jgi:hypothetical protein